MAPSTGAAATSEATPRSDQTSVPENDASHYRFERKFLAGNLAVSEVVLIVKRHPALFFEEYPARWVNNVYLDRIDLKSVHDNLDGLSKRRKTRIRWYGDFSGRIERPVLERKIKSGHLGRKEADVVAAFEVTEDFRSAMVLEACTGADISDRLRHELGALRPTLLNRYSRTYFRSSDRRFRITIDHRMSYHAVGPLTTRLGRWVEDEGKVLVELKYPVHEDREAERIASYFPFRLSRSSKYVTGIELTSPRSAWPVSSRASDRGARSSRPA